MGYYYISPRRQRAPTPQDPSKRGSGLGQSTAGWAAASGQPAPSPWLSGPYHPPPQSGPIVAPPYAAQVPAWYHYPVYTFLPQMAEAPSANTAMIFGIVSTAGAFVSCFLGFLGIIALVYARKPSREIATSGGLLRGRDKVVLGRVLGIIGIVIASLGSVLYFIYFFALMASMSRANA